MPRCNRLTFSLALLGITLGAVTRTSAEPALAAIEFLPTPARDQSAQPHLAARGESLVLSWLEPLDGGGKVLRQAVLGDAGWQARPAVASGARWFVNWADFPSVEPIDGALWAAHWLARRPGGRYSYDVTLSLSQDAGETWSAPFLAHTDGTATEHGFVSLFPWEGAVGAVWLDGRNTGGGEGHEAHGANSTGAITNGMTLRAGRFAADGERLQAVEVDALVCDCCQTDVAVTAAGPVVAYRDRTQDEVRDIHVARLVDGTWRLAGPVDDQAPWQVRGCPVNGPAIDASGQRVVVAWYTGANDAPKVKVAWSADGGATFTPAITIDDDGPLGRVDVSLLADGQTALVSWLRRTGEGERGEISLRLVGQAGVSGPIVPLVQTLAARPSGFPQLALASDALVMVWTDAQAERIRSARVPLAALGAGEAYEGP